MSSIETYDGLCGIIYYMSSGDLRLRCHFPMGHAGPCSWEKYKKHFTINGDTFLTSPAVHVKMIPSDNER
jgi:hypothetical protein